MANTNPLRILFVRTPEGKQRLGPLMSDGNRDKTVSAPAVAVLAVDTDFHDKIPELLPFRPEMRENFVADGENRERLATFNGALQAGYFILAVRAAGLAAGPMLGFNAAGIDAEFFPDRSWKTILVVNIGKPGIDPWFDRLPRLAHEDYVEYA
jgi:3-hydroxypropanoate dehydrogenase